MRKESQRWEKPSTDAEERRALRRARRLCKDPEVSPSNSTEPDNVGEPSIDIKSTQELSQPNPALSANDSVIPSNVRVSLSSIVQALKPCHLMWAKTLFGKCNDPCIAFSRLADCVGLHQSRRKFAAGFRLPHWPPTHRQPCLPALDSVGIREQHLCISFEPGSFDGPASTHMRAVRSQAQPAHQTRR